MNHDDDQPVDFEAVRRHDAEHPAGWQPIRCGWSVGLARKGPLTDKQIAKYQEQGWYSAEFKQARKDRMEKNRKKKRDGNFDLVDGRMIYRPS